MRLWIQALTLSLAATVWSARAEALQGGVSQSHRLFIEYLPQALEASAIRLPETTPTDGTHRLEYQLHAQAVLRGRPTDVLGLQLGLDTGLFSVSGRGAQIDARDLDKALLQTGLLGETHAEVQLGASGFVLVRAGKLRPTLGAGAIFDAYALGLMLDVDLSYLDAAPNLFARAHLLLPDPTFTDRLKHSPLINLEAGWRGEGRDKVVLMGAVFFDRDNALEPLFRDAMTRGGLLRLSENLDQRVEAIAAPRLREAARATSAQLMRDLVTRYNAGDGGFDVTGSGTAGWLGLLADLEAGPLLLQARAILGLGQMQSRVQAGTELQATLRERLANFPNQGQAVIDALDKQGTVPLLAYFVSLDAELELMPELSAHAFALVISGEDRLSLGANDPYNGFISLAPLLPYTSLFFRGGVATQLSSPTVASMAPDGAGVLGGGLGLNAWFKPVHVQAVVAALGSEVQSAFASGRWYGVEANLGVHSALGELFELGADVAVFLPGSYFGEGVPVAVQAISTLTVNFPEF